MSREILIYGGVPMQVIMTKEIARRHVFTDDGSNTYLHTRWTLDLKNTINAATIGSLFLLGLNSPKSPAQIDATLRLYLRAPRRELIFIQATDGTTGDVVLNVPNNNTNLDEAVMRVELEKAGIDDLNNPMRQTASDTFLTDCANGPIVEDFDITHDVACKTWIIGIRIVACVRECPLPSRHGSSPIISHRWTRSMSTEGEKGGYLSFVETSGEVIFDSAWLLSNGLQTDANNNSTYRWTGQFPDQFRYDLFHPIPGNCQRSHIDVTQQSDGITYNYTFRDQEKHFNTLPACHLEAFKTTGFSMTSFQSALAGQFLAGNGGGGIAGAAAAAVPAAIGGLSLVPGGFRDAARGLLSIFGAQDISSVSNRVSAGLLTNATIRQTIPKFTTHVLVRAWGTRNTPKSVLLMQALGVAVRNIESRQNVELIITYELTGKYVEVQYTNTTGPEMIVKLTERRLSDLTERLNNNFSVANIANGDFTALGLGGTDKVLSTFALEAVGQMLDTPENDYAFDQDEEVMQEKWQGAWAASEDFRNAFPDATQEGGVGFKYGNMQPPLSNYTRGTLICNLISQALHSPCQAPPCPPNETEWKGDRELGCSRAGQPPPITVTTPPNDDPPRPPDPPLTEFMLRPPPVVPPFQDIIEWRGQ